MSIRCVFRSLVSVVQPASLHFISSRAPPTRPKIAPFKSGRLLALAFIALFFPLPRGATENRKHTPPKDNYNKSRLHNILWRTLRGERKNIIRDSTFRNY